MTQTAARLSLTNDHRLPSVPPAVPPRSFESSVYEVLISAAPPDNSLSLPIEGGSDSGSFCLIGKFINTSRLTYHTSKSSAVLRPGDIILEIGDYQVAGYTRLDAERLCGNVSRADSKGDRPRVLLKLIPPTSLPTGTSELHNFLSAQFPMGTPEFLLQEVARDNIYQRVVPCEFIIPFPPIFCHKGC